MDIEGFEYEVLSGFDLANTCGFPTQISIEIHWKVCVGVGVSNTWTPYGNLARLAWSSPFPTSPILQRLYDLTNFLGDRNNWESMLWPMHEVSLAELAVVFSHLADLGYAVVSREDNPLVRVLKCATSHANTPLTNEHNNNVQAARYDGCAAEFTLIRVQQPHTCGGIS